MAGGDADAFGDARAELGWGHDFGMSAVAEDQTLQLVVDHYLQRELDRTVAEALLHFLRSMERLRLDVWGLPPVNLDHDSTRLVVNVFGDADGVVEEMFRVKVHALLERMLLIYGDRVDAVEGEDVDLRHAVGCLLAY